MTRKTMKRVLDEEVDKLCRDGLSLVDAIETKMKHMRLLLENKQAPLMYSDMGRDEIYALSGIATAVGMARNLQNRKKR